MPNSYNFVGHKSLDGDTKESTTRSKGADMAVDVEPGLAAKLADWGWAIISALLTVVWAMHNKRMDRIEQDIAEKEKSHNAEMGRQRDNIAKLFDKLEEHARRSEDRHREILSKQSDLMVALHTGLAGKADR